MNLLVSGEGRPRALLALEDGTTFEGLCAGAAGEAFGEVVFNTSMVGYQEVVSDPSYAGQIVTLTYPQVGNYGINPHDMQSGALALRGLVVHDMCHTPSNWQSTQSLPGLLEERGVVAIEGVDTRALTLRIREGGAMRAAISTVDLDPASLVARVRASEPISAYNHVPDVSCGEPHEVPAVPREGRDLHVVAYDCGMKEGIARRMAQTGIRMTVVPWDTPAEEALAMGPDGVFLSNGPGDPEQVDATRVAAERLLGRVPVFGICLGNQIVSLAAGAKVEKLPYGHHGGNEPVMNLLTGKVEITAQNHNYGPVFETFGPLMAQESGGYAEHAHDLRAWSERHAAPVALNPRFGRVRLTHVNLNDGTPEGLQFLDIPAFSMQYHPEAWPGPNDSAYAFEAFARLMEAWRDRTPGDAAPHDYLTIDVRERRGR